MKKSNKVVDLKKSKEVYFRVSLFVSLLIFILLFYLFPNYALHPYVPRVDKPTQLEDVIDPIEKVEELPPPEKPQLPVEAESEDEIQQATIEKTANFETFDKLPLQPESETPDFKVYDTPPRPKQVVKPEYPEIAKKAGIEGTIILKLLIDVDGKVLKAKILKGLTPDLNDAAIEAAYATLFYPAKQRDKPVRVWVSMPMIFKLK